MLSLKTMCLKQKNAQEAVTLISISTASKRKPTGNKYKIKKTKGKKKMFPVLKLVRGINQFNMSRTIFH